MELRIKSSSALIPIKLGNNAHYAESYLVPAYAVVTCCPRMLQSPTVPVFYHDGDYGVVNKESQR
jgi:hypothetical protein